MDNTNLEILKAKEVLIKNGYFANNLWHVNDVKTLFDCDDAVAQFVLERSLTNEATMQEIWSSIKDFGRYNNLKEKE